LFDGGEMKSERSSALLVIDVQNGMFSDPKDPVYQGEKLIETIKKLIYEMRQKSFPIIYVRHEGPPGSPLEKGSYGYEIRSEITPLKSDSIINKTTPNSFVNTNLQSLLDDRNITELIICGLQSELCIDTTCRQAAALGYKVILIEDGHSTFDTEILPAEKIRMHHNALLQGWFVTIKTSSEILQIIN
jgi:nicotinamidase-related amidase